MGEKNQNIALIFGMDLATIIFVAKHLSLKSMTLTIELNYLQQNMDGRDKN